MFHLPAHLRARRTIQTQHYLDFQIRLVARNRFIGLARRVRSPLLKRCGLRRDARLEARDDGTAAATTVPWSNHSDCNKDGDNAPSCRARALFHDDDAPKGYDDGEIKTETRTSHERDQAFVSETLPTWRTRPKCLSSSRGDGHRSFSQLGQGLTEVAVPASVDHPSVIIHFITNTCRRCITTPFNSCS